MSTVDTTDTAAYRRSELDRAAAGLPSTIPCPGWCELRDAHPYDVPTLDSTTRMHRREVPARDGAPNVVIWALDVLEADHRELVEAEVGARDHNQADVSLRHVPAFLEAMQEGARIVEEHAAEPGFRLYTDDEMDQALTEMAAEPIDSAAVLRGVDAVMQSIAGIALPSTPRTAVDVDTADGNSLILMPGDHGTNGAVLMLPGATVHLDDNDLVNLAAAAIRLRVLFSTSGGRPA